MKSYLLIDLDKKVTHHDALPEGEASQVLFFAKKKKNWAWAKKCVQQHQNAVLVKVGKDEKMVAVLVKKLEKILKKQTDANIMIESPRKKMVKRVDKLLNRYPEACIFLSDYGLSASDDDNNDIQNNPQTEIQACDKQDPNHSSPKSVVQTEKGLLQPETSPKPQTVQSTENKLMGKPELYVPENKFVSKQEYTHFGQGEVQLPEIKGSKKIKTKLTGAELGQNNNAYSTDLLDKLAQNHSESEMPRILPLSSFEFEVVSKRLDALMNLLKKNNIKKKDSLIRELAQYLNVGHDGANEFLRRLQMLGIVHVEGDTVKFNNLIHLVKPR